MNAAVTVIISLLVAAAIWRKPAEPAQTELAAADGGMGWVWIGVSISTLVLLFSVVWTMAVLARVTSPGTKPALTVEITGRQWWWQVRYLSGDPAQVFTTADEIHIPAGVPVKFVLIGGDVIHSFWVPALGGKTDLIPGQTNETWLEAHAPGIYRGQCAEYCGVEHAKMSLLVIAQTMRDFEAWRVREMQSPARPASGEQWAGQALFVAHCGACHAVRGTDAGGQLGPDLSHLTSRKTLAAGSLPNDAAHLAQWISDPQGVKPGNLMQKPDLAPNELRDVVAYLGTLQ